MKTFNQDKKLSVEEIARMMDLLDAKEEVITQETVKKLSLRK